VYLSKIQQEAVEYIKTPLLLCSGAGSGKTRVLTHKFAYLINELNFNPNRILCITFTNKAANELKERVSKLVNTENLYLTWVSTIHSSCLKMLRNNLNLIEFNEETSIFGTKERNKLIKKIIKDFRWNKFKKSFWILSEIIGTAKNQFEPIKYLENYKVENIIDIPKLTNEQLVDFFYKYMEELKENNALDFDDILWYTWYLLYNNIDFRNKWSNYFQYILIDEYQDINTIQNAIFQLLVNNKPKITAVGDDYQSIFLWRSADPKYFIEFDRFYPNGKIMFMEQNYRSTVPIIESSNELIKNNEFQIQKKCFSKTKSIIKPTIVKYDNNIKEAREIISNCKLCVERFNYNLNDIAILFRVRALSRVIEEELVENQIPYRIVGAIEFLERREIKDMLSYLSFLNNLKDKISFERLISAPRRGIGAKTVQNLYQLQGNDIADKIITGLKGHYFSKNINTNLSKILNLVSVRKTLTPLKLIEKIYEDFKFEEYLGKISSDETEAESKIENIKELKSMSKKYKELPSFMESIQLLIENKKEERDAINLMTIHAAKGLEFKTIFVIGLEESYLPHFLSYGEKEKLEEERRLLYVAMTRAEKFLFLSHCITRGRGALQPSRFLKEIYHKCQIIDTTEENIDDRYRDI